MPRVSKALAERKPPIYEIKVVTVGGATIELQGEAEVMQEWMFLRDGEWTTWCIPLSRVDYYTTTPLPK